MPNLRTLFYLMRADFLERVRSYGFLALLLFTVFLTYLFIPEISDIQIAGLNLGGYRAIYNSAWIGTMTTLLMGEFFLLFSFYLIKGSIERDRRTGVGPTPLLLDGAGQWRPGNRCVGLSLVPTGKVFVVDFSVTVVKADVSESVSGVHPQIAAHIVSRPSPRCNGGGMFLPDHNHTGSALNRVVVGNGAHGGNDAVAQLMQYEEMKFATPRARNRPMISSGTRRITVGSLATKLPSIMGFIRAAKPVLVAANTSMASTDSAKPFQCGRL